MKINQAAELVGITSKNIRFYEDQGLINPGRDPQNGYREYSVEDINELSRIKLLRQLGVSCDNIRKMQTGALDFDQCMHDHIKVLEQKGEDISHMKSMCELLSDEVDNISEINASTYLDKMKELEKGGVSFMNVESSDVKKRKIGAILSAGFIIAITLAVLGFVVWAETEEPGPIVIIGIIFFVSMATIAGVAYALKQRLNEVEKGEIDEAGKY